MNKQVFLQSSSFYYLIFIKLAYLVPWIKTWKCNCFYCAVYFTHTLKLASRLTVLTSLSLLKVQLPGMKWLESHKGVFHVAVRAVSSIYTQVNNHSFKIFIYNLSVWRGVWVHRLKLILRNEMQYCVNTMFISLLCIFNKHSSGL